MTPGTILWRCRLCGETAPGVHVADIRAHLAALIDGPRKSDRIGTHECRHGSIGVTDLCGALPDEPLSVPAFHELVTEEPK